MKKFATMALLGVKVCGKSDPVYKLLSLGQLDEQTFLDDKTKYLANLMGIDDQNLDHDSSNALSDMAYALMDENFHYTAGENEKIPTYHVVHSEDEILEKQKA